MQYLIWSFEHRAWWGPDRCGYTTDIERAGRYTKEEAGEIVTSSIMVEEVAIAVGIALDWGPPTHDPYGRD